MNYRNLIIGHVVNLILSFPTHCKFINYGGKEDGTEELHARIINSFDIPETGFLQTCYTGKRLSMKKVIDLVKDLVDKDRLDSVIDLWKEICKHTDSSDMRLVGYAQEIEMIAIRNGYSDNQFLDIVAPTLKYSQANKVEEFVNSALSHTEKAIDAKTPEGCQYYIDKLKRVLVSYPFIQPTFIAEFFDQEFLDELTELNFPETRANTLWSKIKEMNKYKMEKSVTDSNKDFSVCKEEVIYEGQNPYVQFMGTEHLTAPVFNWVSDVPRLAQECSLIGGLMVSLGNGDKSVIGIVKALIHRSPNQKVLCRDIFILPSDFEDFDSYDRRKRGMILDEIFDELANPVKTEVKKEADPMPSFPQYPNLTEEEEPVKDSLYMQLIKAAHPEAYETIKVSGDESEENINAILSHHVKGLDLTDLPKPSFRYELPEDKRTGVIIKGNPEDPMVQQLAEMFKVDINKVKPVESPEQEPSIKEILSNTQSISNFTQLVKMLENRPTFKSRLNENLEQRKTGMDHFNKIEELARQLDGSFKALTGIDPSTLNGDCQDPDCPVHGKKISEYQKRLVDLVVGIELTEKGSNVFINPELGKARSKGPFDFSGMLKFIENHFDPEPKKPTVSEIETKSHAVITQNFIIHDVKGEFFCEYKMIWTPALTRFMFSHNVPGNEEGRQFQHIRELTQRLTQDEAFKVFQSLRRDVIANGAHNPRPNPLTSY